MDFLQLMPLKTCSMLIQCYQLLASVDQALLPRIEFSQRETYI